MNKVLEGLLYDILIVGGLGIFVHGIARVHSPSGQIVAGLVIVAIGVVLTRYRKRGHNE